MTRLDEDWSECFRIIVGGLGAIGLFWLMDTINEAEASLGKRKGGR